MQVTAGTTYVAGYYAPAAHYADDSGYFSSAMNNSPLHAPASSGVYIYGNNKFPTKTYNAANYWVDPIFWATQPPDLAPPVVTTTNPINGQTSVPVTAPSFTFGKAIQASTITFSLTRRGSRRCRDHLLQRGDKHRDVHPVVQPVERHSLHSHGFGARTTTGLPMASAYSWTFTTAQPTAGRAVPMFNLAGLDTARRTVSQRPELGQGRGDIHPGDERAVSPASASTRGQATLVPTSVACGRPVAPCSDR